MNLGGPGCSSLAAVVLLLFGSSARPSSPAARGRAKHEFESATRRAAPRPTAPG